MDVSRETCDVTTKPTCYDLTSILVPRCVALRLTVHAVAVEGQLPQPEARLRLSGARRGETEL